MLKKQLNTKSIARIAAIQTLYQYKDDQTNIESLLLKMVAFYKAKDIKADYEINDSDKLKIKPSYNYLQELVMFTHKNIANIDSIIETHLTKQFTLPKLPKLLHAILRIAICEITYFPEVPRKVIINEYTDIASDMLSENEIGFVNSLLDKYSTIR